jgi:peptidoglycan/xylan/chitin deacetylase (PgdA/CDA1 family)
VRLKGLYLSPRLFDRQLADLRAAGFTTGFGEPIHLNGNSANKISLTFDDGFANVLEHGLKPLARNGFTAIQFLVADLLGGLNRWEIAQGETAERLMDAAQVRAWIAAGHAIGSHGLTHPFLTQIAPARAREEIFASKRKLEDLFGLPVQHFCYPYGDWNPAVRDLVAEAGYQSACTTDFGVNTAATPAFELKRITARYQTLSLKALKARLSAWI